MKFLYKTVMLLMLLLFCVGSVCAADNSTDNINDYNTMRACIDRLEANDVTQTNMINELNTTVNNQAIKINELNTTVNDLKEDNKALREDNKILKEEIKELNREIILINGTDLDMSFKDGSKYTVKVIDNNGSPVPNAKVIIKVNTVSYDCSTK